MVWWHQLYQSVLTTVLHITLVIVNQDLYATCPSLRHPTTIQDHIKQSTALSPRHLQTSTGMLSGPFAFLCFILFIPALSFLLTNPLHFLIHQLTSVLSHSSLMSFSFLNTFSSLHFHHYPDSPKLAAYIF